MTKQASARNVRGRTQSRVEIPTFKAVKAELDKALGKPKKRGALFHYTAPASVATYIKRVRAAGGSASLCAAYPAREFVVVDGPPSALMDLVTWVSWQSRSSRNALDLLHADAGLTVANINYTDFVVKLDRVPAEPAAHAERLAKIVMQGDAREIAAALKKRRWKTG